LQGGDPVDAAATKGLFSLAGKAFDAYTAYCNKEANAGHNVSLGGRTAAAFKAVASTLKEWLTNFYDMIVGILPSFDTIQKKVTAFFTTIWRGLSTLACKASRQFKMFAKSIFKFFCPDYNPQDVDIDFSAEALSSDTLDDEFFPPSQALVLQAGEVETHWWDPLRNTFSEFGKVLTQLCSTIVSAIFPDTFRETTVKKWCSDLQSFLSLSNAIDRFDPVNSFKKMIDWIYCKLTGDNYYEEFRIKRVFAELNSNLIDLIDEADKIKLPDNNRSAEISILTHRLTSIYNRFVLCFPKESGPARTLYNATLERARKYTSYIESAIPRIKPVAACFFGVSNTGKTTAVDTLCKELPINITRYFTSKIDRTKDHADDILSAWASHSQNPARQMLRCTEEPHKYPAEGYDKQMFVIFDEIYTSTSALINNAWGARFMSYNDQSNLKMDAASIEGKAGIYFNSPFVFCTGNSTNAHTMVVKDPTAYFRRIDFDFVVSRPQGSTSMREGTVFTLSPMCQRILTNPDLAPNRALKLLNLSANQQFSYAQVAQLLLITYVDRLVSYSEGKNCDIPDYTSALPDIGGLIDAKPFTNDLTASPIVVSDKPILKRYLPEEFDDSYTNTYPSKNLRSAMYITVQGITRVDQLSLAEYHRGLLVMPDSKPDTSDHPTPRITYKMHDDTEWLKILSWADKRPLSTKDKASWVNEVIRTPEKFNSVDVLYFLSLFGYIHIYVQHSNSNKEKEVPVEKYKRDGFKYIGEQENWILMGSDTAQKDLEDYINSLPPSVDIVTQGGLPMTYNDWCRRGHHIYLTKYVCLNTRDLFEETCKVLGGIDESDIRQLTAEGLTFTLDTNIDRFTLYARKRAYIGKQLKNMHDHVDFSAPLSDKDFRYSVKCIKVYYLAMFHIRQMCISTGLATKKRRNFAVQTLERNMIASAVLTWPNSSQIVVANLDKNHYYPRNAADVKLARENREKAQQAHRDRVNANRRRHREWLAKKAELRAQRAAMSQQTNAFKKGGKHYDSYQSDDENYYDHLDDSRIEERQGHEFTDQDGYTFVRDDFDPQYYERDRWSEYDYWSSVKEEAGYGEYVTQGYSAGTLPRCRNWEARKALLKEMLRPKTWLETLWRIEKPVPQTAAQVRNIAHRLNSKTDLADFEIITGLPVSFLEGLAHRYEKAELDLIYQNMPPNLHRISWLYLLLFWDTRKTEGSTPSTKKLRRIASAAYYAWCLHRGIPKDNWYYYVDKYQTFEANEPGMETWEHAFKSIGDAHQKSLGGSELFLEIFQKAQQYHRLPFIQKIVLSAREFMADLLSSVGVVVMSGIFAAALATMVGFVCKYCFDFGKETIEPIVVNLPQSTVDELNHHAATTGMLFQSGENPSQTPPKITDAQSLAAYYKLHPEMQPKLQSENSDAIASKVHRNMYFIQGELGSKIGYLTFVTGTIAVMNSHIYHALCDPHGYLRALPVVTFPGMTRPKFPFNSMKVLHDENDVVIVDIPDARAHSNLLPHMASLEEIMANPLPRAQFMITTKTDYLPTLDPIAHYKLCANDVRAVKNTYTGLQVELRERVEYSWLGAKPSACGSIGVVEFNGTYKLTHIHGAGLAAHHFGVGMLLTKEIFEKAMNVEMQCGSDIALDIERDGIVTISEDHIQSPFRTFATGRSRLVPTPFLEHDFENAPKFPASLDNEAYKRALIKEMSTSEAHTNVTVSWILSFYPQLLITKLFDSFSVSLKGCRTLTFDEALYGIPGRLDAFDLHTARGLTLKKLGIRKKDLADPSHPSVAKLRAYVEEQMSKFRKGEFYAQVNCDCLKDELRDRERVRLKKTRVFNVTDFVDNLLIKMALGDLVSRMHLYFGANASYCGVNPCSSMWGDLYSKFAKFVSIVFGDISGWDHTSILGFRRIICEFFRQCYGGDPKSFSVKFACWAYIAARCCLRFNNGEARLLLRGNSSGNWCTTFFNTLDNILNHTIICIKLALDFGCDPFIAVYQLVLAIYSDDNISAHPESWWNPLNVSTEFKKLFGITFTSTDKGELDCDKVYTIDDADFLSRKFEKRKGIVFAPLSKESLLAQLYFIRVPKSYSSDFVLSQLQINLDNVARELLEYSEAEASIITNHIRDVINTHNIEVTFNPVYTSRIEMKLSYY